MNCSAPNCPARPNVPAPKFLAELLAVCAVLGGLVLAGSGPLHAEDSATGASPERYLLRYKLTPGERIRYEVIHVAKTKTRVLGQEEASNVHTTSQRHWDVVDADAGEATFEHMIDAVAMTQQQGDSEEIRWDSASGDQPPEEFARVAEKIGNKLASVTIDDRGQEVSREDFGGTKSELGMGSLTLSFPEEPLAIGDTWSVPREIKARTDDGKVKIVKIRERYKLKQVKTGVATLSVRSEPLTPLSTASLKSQVVQQLSNGQIRFDIDAGRMLSKKLNWDETVVGFQGPNSLMEYRARITEELVEDTARNARLP